MSFFTPKPGEVFGYTDLDTLAGPRQRQLEATLALGLEQPFSYDSFRQKDPALMEWATEVAGSFNRTWREDTEHTAAVYYGLATAQQLGALLVGPTEAELPYEIPTDEELTQTELVHLIPVRYLQPCEILPGLISSYPIEGHRMQSVLSMGLGLALIEHNRFRQYGEQQLASMQQAF